MSDAPATMAMLIGAFETHDVGEIERCLDAGLDVTAPHDGRSITTWLLESYLRSERFGRCLGLLMDAGAPLDQPALEPVLLQDRAAIRSAARADPDWCSMRVSMRSTFTSLQGASLLHVAAEYGLDDSARALVDLGVDVDTMATVDAHGRGGHTPLFHTVHAHKDFGAAVRRTLLAAGARTDVLVPALVWGEAFEWETTFFDVTPISYCHTGLLRQVHRDERTIFAVMQELLRAAGRPVPPLGNVPNAYLGGS